MNIKEWVKDNKLLSIAVVVVIIYILIVSGTRKVPVAKEVKSPAETAAEAPTEKAAVPETAPIIIEEQVNQTQEEIPSPGSVEEKSTG